MTSLRNTLIAIALVVVVLWAAFGFFGYYVLPDWTTRGQFGDLFGAVNALFSGLAFVGVVAALLLQLRELQDTKADVSRTLDLLHKQTMIMETQARALREQEAVSYRQLEATKQQLRAEIFGLFWQADRHRLEQTKSIARAKVIRRNMRSIESDLVRIFNAPMGRPSVE